MTRHWFGIAGGLVLATMLTAASMAQVSTAPAIMPNQGTNLRPGWSREGMDPAAARSRFTVSPAPTQLVDTSSSSSSSGFSLLPNWFGKRNEQQSQQNKAKPSQKTGGQPNAKPSSNQPRVAMG